MKRFLLLFIIGLFSSSSFSQVSEVVEEFWHLNYLQIDGERYYAPLGENINLVFDPVNNDYVVGANAIENGLSADGVFSGNSLTLSNLSITLLGCDQENCYYEDLYFYSFITTETLETKIFTYDYDSYSNGTKTLELVDANNNKAFYGNEPVMPDPLLFQTWYLFQTEADLKPPTPVTSSNPPQITINNDLTFTGINDCATFEGNFGYETVNDYEFLLQLQNLEIDESNCSQTIGTGIPDLMEEIPLRSFVEGSTSGPDYFLIESFPGFISSFRNVLLETPENSLLAISIYPK